MNRRNFLKTAGATLSSAALIGVGCASETESGAPAPAAAPAATPAPNISGNGLARIGVQLYTVRSLMEDDFAGTLERIAQIGYDEVEFAGYYNQQPIAVKALLDQLGLRAPSVHVPFDQLQDNIGGVLTAAETIGHRYVVLPWVGERMRSADGYRRLAEFCNTAGRACRDRGIQFAYHNHDFEFDTFGSTTGYDILLEETDPQLVQMELDLFWITKAGYDPVDYFARYPGRFPLCHVKDMTGITGDQEMVPVGAGEIDFAGLFGHIDHAGMKHFFVEHDNPGDPLASIQSSYTHLSGLTF